MTTIRLATGPGPGKGGARYAKGLADMTTIRLSMAGGQAERNGKAIAEKETRPALLVSFIYLDIFQKHRPRQFFRDWVLDSGAFSAWTQGKVIDLAEFTASAKDLLQSDDQLSEVYALDVIGDWRASLKNAEAMWKAGVQAIPTFHVGEPWDVLVSLARDYPKIALGGMVGYGQKRAWIEQCFARVWPKRIHGFGLMDEKILSAVPFESVDASNWELGPVAFGRWPAFGNSSLKIRGGEQNLRPEVERILKMERKLKWRWRREMAEIGSL